MRPAALLFLISACASAQTIHGVFSSGNSHSDGYFASPALTTTQPYSNLMLNGSVFAALVEVSVESPSSMTGNQITKASSGYVVSVVNRAQDGAAYQDVKQGTTTYNALISAVTTAVSAAAGLGRPFNAVATVYEAGGTDFDNQIQASTYQANMTTLQQNYQTDMFAQSSQTGVLPLFLDMANNWTEVSETPTYPGGANGIQFGVWAAWMANQGKIYIIGPHYQQTFQPSGSGQDHMDNYSNRTYGEMTGKTMKQVLVDGKAWVPLVPRAISISGATITFQCWVPVPPLVVDTTFVRPDGSTIPDFTGGVGTSGAFRYKGFEFFDDSGSPPHVTAITVSSGDTLTITLASTPTGTTGSFRLRYDYTGTENSIQGTSGAPGGNIHDSDATPSVSGDSLVNWLLGPVDNPIPYSWSPSVISLTSASSISGGAPVGVVIH